MIVAREDWEYCILGLAFKVGHQRRMLKRLGWGFLKLAEVTTYVRWACSLRPPAMEMTC